MFKQLWHDIKALYVQARKDIRAAIDSARLYLAVKIGGNALFILHCEMHAKAYSTGFADGRRTKDEPDAAPDIHFPPDLQNIVGSEGK